MDAIARGLATRALAEIALIDTGQPVELRTTSTHLQWRRVGDTNWTNLVPLVDTGSALDFDWDGTSLGVKRRTEATYTYVDLLGPKGDKGDKGDGLEFQWDGTILKVRVEGDTTWDSVDLQGEQGPEASMPPRLAEQAIPANPDVTEESGWTTEGTPVESTFTRASQAWDGTGLVAPDTMRVFGRDTKSPVVLIEGQRTNLISRSNTLPNVYAGTTLDENAGVAPDGTLTAAKITYDGSGEPGTYRAIQSTGTVPDGENRVASIWLRAEQPTTVS